MVGAASHPQKREPARTHSWPVLANQQPLEKHTEHKHDRLPHPRKAHEEYKRHAPRVPTDCSQPRSGKVSQRTEDDPAHRGNTKPSGTPTPTPTPNPNPNPNPNSGQVPCEMAFVFRATPKQTGVLTHVEMLGLGLGLGSSLMSKAAALTLTLTLTQVLMLTRKLRGADLAGSVFGATVDPVLFPD